MVPVAVDVHNLTDASWSRWRSGHAIAQAGGCTTQGSQPQARKRQHLWLRKECNRLSAHVTVQSCGDLLIIRPLVEGQPSTELP